ncbi:hypothetical protein [Nonomuraea guangzhouensis]|uniref:Fibronectin type-III domain-containing protein n=1 Tax=Nonomuraea guangzhouensis TaxID=1291555 RepID=A0ABW4GYH5_9ACTN|nr:hypothetical protein [Nonomuraea guangzhouensis]
MTVVGRAIVATAVVAGSIVLGGSAQAAVVMRQGASSGEITSPSDGQVVTSGSVPISARTGVMQLNMGVYVEGPSTAKQKVAGGGANQTLSGTFDAGSAPNGTFNVVLKGEITGTTYATSTFKLRRPAAAPDNVAAALEGTEKIVVTWSKGSEPDLQSYEVATSQSGIVGRLPADSACSGSSCKAVLAVPSKAAGQRVGFTVKAFRGDGDGGSIGSGNSGAAYVTVPGPPTAKPKKTATKQETPTTKKGVDTLPTLPGKKHTQPTAAPTRKATTTKNTNKLPAMPDTDPKGNLPIPTADTTGDSGKTDGLTPDGTKGDAESAPVDSRVKAQSSESPTGSIGQYGMYVAGGLVLLLLAAHGGAWARRRSLAGAGAGGSVPHSAAASPSLGISAQPSTDSVPPTASAPRRPAVVLAVAKIRPVGEHPRTQSPEQSRAPERSGAQTPERSRASERRGAAQAPGASRTPPGRSGAQTPARSRMRALESHMQALEHPGSAASDLPGPGVSDQPGPGASGPGAPASGGSTLEASGLEVSDRFGQGVNGVPRPSGSDGFGSGGSEKLGVVSSDRFNSTPSDLLATPSAARRYAERPSAGRGYGPETGHARAQVRAALPLHLSDADMGAADPDDRASGGQDGRTGAEQVSWLSGEQDGQVGAGQVSWVSGERDGRADAGRYDLVSVDQDGWRGAARADREPLDQPSRMRVEPDGRTARQEPVRIALPSSAVIEVPESAAAVTPPVVRIEERWDDYLPPAPRAMEDSGFWERPQPGAGDFWAADDDENAFAGHRHRGGDS